MELKHIKYIRDETQRIQAEQDALWDMFDDMWPTGNRFDTETQTYVTRKDYSLVNELEKLEKDRIEDALETFNGNRTKAANFLNIGRTNLLAKMKKYEIA